MLVFESGTGVSDGGTSRVNGDRSETGAVLVPVVTDGVSAGALGIAISIADHSGTDLLITGMETIPEQTPLDHPELPIAGDRWVRNSIEMATALGAHPSEVLGATLVGRDIKRMIAHEVDGRDVQILVLEQADGSTAGGSPLVESIDSVFESVGCDVVLTTGAEHLENLSTILVPVAGGPHSGMAVDIAMALALENEAWIELFHVVNPDASEDVRRSGEQYVEAALDRLGEFEHVDTWIYEAPDVAEAIIEQTRYYDLTILGAPRKGRLKRFVFGSKTETIRERADSTVVTVRSNETEQNWFESWLDRQG